MEDIQNQIDTKEYQIGELENMINTLASWLWITDIIEQLQEAINLLEEEIIELKEELEEWN